MPIGNRVAAHENAVRFIDEEDWDGTEVNGSAFERPLKDQDGVSLTRLAFFDPADPARDLAQIKAVMLSRKVPLSEGYLAVINVGAIEAVGLHYSTPIAVYESRSKRRSGRLANPAHAIIVETPFIGEAQADAIADRLGIAVHDVLQTTLP